MTARPITRRTATARRAATRGPLGALAALGAFAALALPAAAVADGSVSISDSGYTPAVVTIKQGEVVTWTNDGKRDHTVTSDTGTTMQSDVLGPGDAFATLFKTPGTFRYHSTVQPDQMHGSVVVRAAPMPTTTGPTPPTGTLPEGFTPSPGVTVPDETDTGAGQDETTDWLKVSIPLIVAAVAAVALILLLLRRRRRRRRAV